MFHGNAYFFWYGFGFASHTWLSFEMLKINLQWGNTLRLTQSVQSSAYSFTALGQWYTCIMWRLSKKKKNCSNWRSSVCVNFMLFLTFFSSIIIFVIFCDFFLPRYLILNWKFKQIISEPISEVIQIFWILNQ